MNGLDKLTFYEIFLITELEGYTSLRGLATSKGIPVSQVSKIIKKVETITGAKLIKRSTKGYSVTPEAKHIFQTFKSIQKLSAQLSHEVKLTPKEDFFLASRTFLLNAVAGVVSPLFQEDSHSRLGFIDMPSGDIAQAAYNNEIHMALHIEHLKLTEKWVTQEVGQLRWCYFVGENFFNEKKYSLEEVLQDFNIVTAMFWNGKSIKSAGKRGFESVNADPSFYSTDLLSAAEIIKNTPSVAFLPYVPLLKSSEIRPLNLDFPDITQEVFLSVDSSTIQNKRYKMLCDKLRQVFQT